jgi:hypothetical protein
VNNIRFPRYSVSMPIIASPACPPIARTREIIKELPPTYQVTGSSFSLILVDVDRINNCR